MDDELDSFSDLSFDFLELLSDIFEEVLEILFLSVELFQLTLDSAILTLMMSKVTFAE